jgi:hypothetical protein
MVKIEWIYTSSPHVCPCGLNNENFTFICYLVMSISEDVCDCPCVDTHV